MPYIGRGPSKSGAFRILDDVSGDFDGSDTTFALTVASTALTVGLPETLIIAVDGVIQEPGSAYTISGSNIVFGSAPQEAATFWGVELGDVGGIAQQAVTQSAGNNSTSIATTAYVDAQVATEDTIAEMGDVTLSSIASGEVLKWNGSAWINNTLAELGVLPVANPIFTGTLTVGSAALVESELEMLDGITAGTAAASKALVLDGSTNITGIGTIGSGAITSSGVVTATGFTIGSAVITEAELEILDGATVTTTELNVLDALDRGSILYGNASGVTTVLGQGGANTVLTSDGTDIAWQAAAGGPCQADKCELQDQDNLDKYAPPDLMHHHPGVAKAWVQVNMNLAPFVKNACYNVTSINDCGTGKLKITLATDFANAHYVAAGMMTHSCANPSNAGVHGWIHGFDADASCTRTSGIFVVQGFSMNTAGTAGEARDAEDFDIVIFGTQ